MLNQNMDADVFIKRVRFLLVMAQISDATDLYEKVQEIKISFNCKKYTDDEISQYTSFVRTYCEKKIMKALLKNIDFIKKCTLDIDVYTKIFEDALEMNTVPESVDDCESSSDSESTNVSLHEQNISSDDEEFSINFDDKND